MPLPLRLLSDGAQSVLLLDEQPTEVEPRLLEPLGLSAREAEVLAWVYQLRRFEAGEGERPIEPVALPVPAELDPGPGVTA